MTKSKLKKKKRLDRWRRAGRIDGESVPGAGLEYGMDG